MPATSLLASIGLRRQRLLAREGEQPAGQRGGALRALQRHVAGARDARSTAGDGGKCGNLAADHVEPAQDDGEQVVEVVRDAAGELADGLHLLRLAQRFLGLACAPRSRLPARGCAP